MSSRHCLKYLVISVIIVLNVSLAIPIDPQEHPKKENQDSAKIFEEIQKTKKIDSAPSNAQNNSPVIDLSLQPLNNGKAQSVNNELSSGTASVTGNKESKKPVTSPAQTLDVVNAVVDTPDTDIFQSGALTRGVLVFIGLTFLLLLYAGFKTYRKRNRRSKRRTVVRRYGGKNYDVEMEPLPLSDEEDDETIFELNGSTSR